MAKAKKSAKASRGSDQTYEVVHNAVGPFPQGRIVSLESLTEHGLDKSHIGRLLGLGALKATTKPETSTALPLGPENPASLPEDAGSTEPDEDEDDEESEDEDDASEDEDDEETEEPADEDDDDDDDSEDDSDESEESDEEDEDDDADADAEELDYKGMTLTALREHGREQKIKNFDSMTKADLIKALEKA